MAKIGPQLFTVREKFTDNNAFEVIKDLNEMGYTSFEVSQVPMTDANINGMKKAIKELGITIDILSCNLEPNKPEDKGEFLSTDFNKFVEIAKELNCNKYRIGMMPIKFLESLETVLEFAKKCDFYAEKFNEVGMELYYHNHHFEFMKYDGKYIFDILKDETKYLGFEIDVFWVQKGGVNPLKYIKEFKERHKIIHLKDYKINTEGKIGSELFAESVIEFAEVGEGNLPMKDIINVGMEIGCEYFFIEQDNCYGKDPMDSLKISKDNLVNLGFEKYL